MRSISDRIKQSAGLSVKRNEISIYSRNVERGSTKVMMRFGNNYQLQDTTDLGLPNAQYGVVVTLPGRAAVIP